MTDSDNDSGNHRNQWSPEDWRTFMITFVGGLASILVGAAMLALAFALARYWDLHNDFFTWFDWVVSPLAILWGLVVIPRRKKRSRFERVVRWSAAAMLTIVALTWIGVAAGIK